MTHGRPPALSSTLGHRRQGPSNICFEINKNIRPQSWLAPDVVDGSHRQGRPITRDTEMHPIRIPSPVIEEALPDFKHTNSTNTRHRVHSPLPYMSSPFPNHSETHRPTKLRDPNQNSFHCVPDDLQVEHLVPDGGLA